MWWEVPCADGEMTLAATLVRLHSPALRDQNNLRAQLLLLIPETATIPVCVHERRLTVDGNLDEAVFGAERVSGERDAVPARGSCAKKTQAVHETETRVASSV